MTVKTSNPDPTKMLYSFDDIRIGNIGEFCGRRVLVVAKGEDVSQSIEGRHIQLQYIDNSETSRRPKVKENVVNRYLNEQRRLWIDFDFVLDPYSEDKE